MNLRKIFAAALSLTMMCSAMTTLSCAPVSAFTAGAVAEEPAVTTDDETVTYPIEAEVYGCKFSLYKDYAVFTKCSSNYEGDFVIPAEVKGLPVTKIQGRAFEFQKQLVSVTIPATVETIGDHLAGYSTLEKYIVDEGNKNFSSVDGVVFTKDMKTLVAFPKCYPNTSYTVPDGVAVIARGAAYTSDIEGLVLPSSVTNVEDFAFTYCKQLKSLRLPSALKTIGYASFSNTALTNVEIPSSVEEIKTSAFANCKDLIVTVKNPACKITQTDGVFGKKDSCIIIGDEGSTAQAYAEKYEYTFGVIGGEIPVITTTGGSTMTTTTSASSSSSTTTTTVTTSAATTSTSQFAETPDLKFGTATPIVKVINGKPYNIKFTGIFSIKGDKVLNENDDAEKIAEIKNGVIASVSQAVMDVEFAPDNASSAGAQIKEKSVEHFNKFYTVKTGYTLTSLSIQSINVTEQAASVVTGSVTTVSTTAQASTTTTTATAVENTSATISNVTTTVLSTTASVTTTKETVADTTASTTNTTAITTGAETTSATSASVVTTTTTITTTAVSTTKAPETTASMTIAEQVAGKWSFQKFVDSDGNVSDKLDGTFANITFNSDGTGKIEVVSDPDAPDNATITWTTDGNEINVLITLDEGEQAPLTFMYADNYLTFERPDGVLYFVKAEENALGDANGDGKIDSKDASLILVEYAKLSTDGVSSFSDAQKAAADVNKDGKTDAKDASALLAYYSYLSTGGKDDISTFLKANV